MKVVFYCLLLLFSVLACNTIAGDGDMRLTRLRNQGTGISGMDLRGLIEMLSSDASPELTDLQLDAYVFPLGCSASLELLWGLAEVSEAKNAELVNTLKEKVSQDIATHCLRGGHAYRSLQEKSPEEALKWIESRASRPATLLDVLVAGCVLWGPSFTPIPAGEPYRIPFAATPSHPPAWKLPFTPARPWNVLFKGRNAAYRMLAVLAMDNWGNDDDRNAFINSGASDSNYEIRRIWLSRLLRLPAEKQEEVLERVISERGTPTVPDKFCEESEKQFNQELNRQLRNVKHEKWRRSR